jgi:dedicator of cytokinesis protein 3
MPWEALPRIAFAVAIYPFQPSAPSDLPLELGDELYIIEQGGKDKSWYRGYLVAPPSLLAGLTSVKGQTLEARVFSGIFPKTCVEVREVLGDTAKEDELLEEDEEEEEAEESSATNGLGAGSANGDGGPSKSNSLKSSKRDSQRSRHNGKKGAAQEPLSKRVSGVESLKRRKLARGPSHRSKGSQRSQKVIDSLKPRQRDPNAPRPPAPVPMLKIGDETPTSAQEPLVDEIASCLREWHSCHLHELLLSRQYQLLEKFSALVREVDFSRRQLLHNVLTNVELKSLREKTVWDLVRGNKLLSDEVIVRDPSERGRMLTGDDSAVDMTRLQAMMSLLNAPPTQPPDAVSLHHLLVSIKYATNTLSEPATLIWDICSKSPGSDPSPITEAYAAHLPQPNASSTSGKLDHLKTLFTDLSAGDVGEGSAAEKELFLVVKVLVKQPLIETISNGSTESIGARDGMSSTRMDMLNGARSISRQTGRRSLMWAQKSSAGSYWAKSSQSYGNAGNRNGPIAEEDLTDTATPTPNLDNGVAGNSEPKAKVLVERFVAVGVLRIKTLLRQGKELDQTINLWAPTMTVTGGQDREAGWDDTIQGLMQSRTNQFVRFRQIENLQLHIKPFLSPDAESLIKNTPTLLQNITATNKIGFSGAPTKARSDIYLALNEAFLPRQALLSHPRNGSTAIPQSLASSHLQLTVEIRRATGERIENCIVPASNRPAASTWSSLSVERGHPFDQTVKLAMPANEVPGCHVLMTLLDGPDSPFALAWMPLWDQQAFIRDGHHSLLLYKYDEYTSIPSTTSSAKGGYLSLPWNSRGKDDVSKDEAVTGPVATLRMHSFLCSTQFSQDKVLLGLLKWKERSAGELTELLQRVIFVPEIEVVKLLSEVFDALFGILVEHAGNDEYEDLVFNALATVLGIVHDRRFNLGPLVDQYAENRFRYPFATSCLIRSFTRLLSNPTESESSRRLRATFKVGKHVLKFIINAREQQKVKEAGIGITTTQPTFTRDLQGIFKSLEALMTSSAPILVGSQTLAVQHFHTWLPELTGLLTTEEILHIAIDFVDSCVDVKGKLILFKLILIINYSKLELFQLAETRRALTVNTVRWLAPHWGTTEFVTQQWRDQVRLCCSVLSTQVSELGVEVSDYIPKVVESYRAIQSTPRKEKGTLSLLFPTAYPFPIKKAAGQPVFDEALIELAAVLAAMSCLPTGIHLDLQEAELSGFLSEALEVHMSIISGEAFPNNWLSVHVYHHKSTMQTLEHLAGILVDSFLPHPDDAERFNTELWRTFFTTLLKLVGSAALALETFPEQKRRAVWKIAGDVREHGADLLRRTWEAIGWETSPEDRRRYGLEKMGGYQVQYVPGLVAPIVELCLSVHEGLRSVAVEVLQTMIVSEWTLSQDLSVVQAEMIDCLDRLFKSKHLTESIQQKLFITDLTELFEPLSSIPDDPLYAAFKDLVATIDEFLDLLAAVHSSDISGEAVHIMHTLRLMEFLRDMQKEDIFIRYVHQLAKVQIDTRNPVEAGLALKLHADLYDWDTIKTVDELSDPVYPEQSAFDRKELLYFEMIKHYEEGKSWDNALAAYRELAEQYESNVFDFAKLARTQRAMAKIYEGIAKGERQTPRYFRVVYRGLGFATGLRDREYIFEGSPSERMSAFTDRMQQQHPSARIISSGEIEDLEGQFLQISGVNPHRDLSHPVYQRPKIPQAMREHLLSAKPCHFSVTSRRFAATPDVKEHYVEKTIYSTAESFPTILRRSEVISSKEVKLSPIQSAIERAVRKTHEITGLEKKHVAGFDYDFGPFSDAINASVDPNSSVSVARYRELLPTKTEEEEELELENEDEPEMTAEENALRIALLDHALVLKRCVALFADNPSNKQRIVFAQQDFTDIKFSLCNILILH